MQQNLDEFSPPKKVITVKEASKLLGSDGKQLSEDQKEKLIDTLTEMAKIMLS